MQNIQRIILDYNGQPPRQLKNSMEDSIIMYNLLDNQKHSVDDWVRDLCFTNWFSKLGELSLIGQEIFSTSG